MQKYEIGLTGFTPVIPFVPLHQIKLHEYEENDTNKNSLQGVFEYLKLRK